MLISSYRHTIIAGGESSGVEWAWDIEVGVGNEG